MGAIIVRKVKKYIEYLFINNLGVTLVDFLKIGHYKVFYNLPFALLDSYQVQGPVLLVAHKPSNDLLKLSEENLCI